MELPHCYQDESAVKPFLSKVKECTPYMAYIAIKGAFVDKDKMFKVVALTHLRNYYRKATISEKDFQELIRLLDTFRDPYQDFVEQRAFRTWTDIKTRILGGRIR